MVAILDGKFVFPVAVWRRELLLKADHLGVPAEVEEVEPLDDVELDVDEPRPPGSSGDGLGGLGSSLAPGPVPGPPMAPFYGLPPGTDTRGLGLESFDGRGPVRKSAGTTRPPTIPPEFWGTYAPATQKTASKD